jgi:hypothetical protein
MKKENIYRYVGETKSPLQIENEDGTFTIIKLIHGLILTKEVVNVATGSGMISPLVDVEMFKEYDIQAEVVEG